ncbi:uncharacterized protein ACLA_098130 [Aspergillus clavatus NRRL 1]|uniref:Uncharacterized protein n=1 Tax=Aspergillus clavatus (strain ATCC 1007 / CBS 513.65 / DSM 816 / NCTC 3887 / NRRL 1 / QM 1276 / 107) TaxID=344612 RepID=A1CMT4_ASPCL|nr:uncharacterized protein ACLA_098130 [Aspergillus clavatus NRRL 1]EAW08871.1 conserved hypothetical protein [Aspergillus clavatus NRRL 1]
MPRRSSRAVPASAAAPAPAPKKRASDRISAASKTDSKRQKYHTTTANKPVKSTNKKSKYFEDEGAEESELDSNHASELEDESGSAYEEAKSTSSHSLGADSGITEDPSTDEEIARKSRARKTGESGQQPQRQGRIKKGNIDGGKDTSDEETAHSLKDKELWREGVSTGLGPGKEVFIKKPKARAAGKTPYQDHTLHPNTMLFLQDLAKHNDRQWLKAHDADYRASKKDWETFVESLTEKISEVDGTIPELPAKDLVFRIHRDIRFSKDPTPYKVSHGQERAVCRLLCASSTWILLCCGLWNPGADKLALLREEIDRNSHRLKAVLQRPDMRREILKGIPDDEKKSVQAFVSQNKESALKTKPKNFLRRLMRYHGSTSAYWRGYDVDNQNIELLRLRSFTIGKPLADSELMASNAQEKIAAIIAVMEPFVSPV